MRQHAAGGEWDETELFEATATRGVREETSVDLQHIILERVRALGWPRACCAAASRLLRLLASVPAAGHAFCTYEQPELDRPA